MLNPTAPSAAPAAASATAPPFLLFSLLPLPCVPVSWRRSAALDLSLSGLCLFLAFLMHDALQETFYHALGVRAPVFITSLDFVSVDTRGIRGYIKSDRKCCSVCATLLCRHSLGSCDFVPACLLCLCL